MKLGPITERLKSLVFPISTALTIAAGLEPLLIISKLASSVLEHWNQLIVTAWDYLLKFVSLDVPIYFYEPATVAVFAVAMGVLSSTRYLKFRNIEVPKSTRYAFISCLLFNLSFYLAYLMLRTNDYMQKNASLQDASNFWEDYLPILAFYVYIFSVLIASQKVLAKKLLMTIYFLLLIIVLDRIYEPLEDFL